MEARLRYRKLLKRAYNRPVIPLLIGLMAGIYVGALIPGHRVWAGVLATGSLVLCGYFLFRKRPARLAPVVLFLAIGYLFIQPWASPHLTDNHVSRYTGIDRWEISGTILTAPVLANHRTRFVLSTETLQNREEAVATNGKIRVTVAGNVSGFAPGDRIGFTSRLHAPRNFNNPGGFDYRRYLAFQAIWATAFSKEGDIRLLSKAPTAGWSSVIDRFRKVIDGLMENAAPEPGPQSLLKALILGDRAGVSKDLREAFKRAGVSHLLAISGLHVGMVAAGAFWLFSSMLAFIRPLLWRGSTRKWAAWLTVIPVMAYGLLAGMSPSTQRAVIMVSVFLAAVCLDREQNPLNTLALAALTILAAHPPSLFSVSFQLSFAAVAAIILGATGWPGGRDRHPSVGRRIGRRVLSFFLVSAMAILGTLPLVMLYFNQVSLIGLLTNVIAVPLIGGCVVPLGLLSALLSPVWPAAALWGFTISGWLLNLSLPVIQALSELPLAAIKTVTPNRFEIGGFYLFLAAALHLAKRAVQSHQPVAASSKAGSSLFLFLRPRQAASVLAVLAVSALSADVAYWLHARFWHRDLRATVIDVGQGNATLLEFPGGPVMLVDGGGFSDHQAFDVGERVVAPYLWQKKIRTVDTLVLSHPDSDHLNGLLYIAEHFHVKQLWSTGDRAESEAYRQLLDIARRQEISRIEFEKFPRIHEINGSRVEILHPPADFISAPPSKTPDNHNNNSLVIRVSTGTHALLLPGDLMAQGEARVVDAHGPALQSTVLLSPHHGSKTSSTEGFLEMVRPQAVIVSAGYRRRGHHPHPTVMARYAEKGADVFCTATNGAVLVSMDDQSTRILPFIGPSGATVYR